VHNISLYHTRCRNTDWLIALVITFIFPGDTTVSADKTFWTSNKPAQWTLCISPWNYFCSRKAMNISHRLHDFYFTAPSHQLDRYKYQIINTRLSLVHNDFVTPVYSFTTSYLLTYSRSWALLEEPPIVQPLKNFPACYGTRRFNTMFTRAIHWSLSWAISIQSKSFHPISLRSILILSTHLPFHHTLF
jgi:hypothetical protein